MYRRGFLSVLLLGFVLGALSTFAYIRIRQQIRRTHLAQMVSPSPSPTPDKTASWNKYTDSNNRFSLKYPPGWNYTIEGPARTLVFSKPDSPMSLSIGVDKANDMKIIVDELSKKGKVEDITLDGITAKTVSFLLPEPGGTRRFRTQQYEFIKNGWHYSLGTSYLQQDTDIGKVLDQILSTFKFTQ